MYSLQLTDWRNVHKKRRHLWSLFWFQNYIVKGMAHMGLAHLVPFWLVGWWLWRAGYISQDTYLLYLTLLFYVFWNGFYTRKVIFIQLQEFPTPPYCRCCSVTKRSDSGIAEALKALKMHFWDPSQWDKMCFEYHRVIFHWKKWVKIFTFAYGQGRQGWPPRPLMVSLTVKYPGFFTSRLIVP